MPAQREAEKTAWVELLEQRLPLYGHRNWIVVADSAYPAQSRQGIETVYTGAGQLEVVDAVVHVATTFRHVKPSVMTDEELDFVEEKDAPGISEYRLRLAALLQPEYQRRVLPHEQIIAKLDSAAAMFKVLVLKTTLAIPYTSVFFELDCKYWTADAESRLRQTLSSRKRQAKP